MVLRLLSAVAIVLLAFAPAAAQPATNSSANWVTAGPVHAVARNGNTIYLGGQFNGISPKSQQIGALGIFQMQFPGRRSCNVPAISGNVHAIASDPSGNFYAAGRFDRVGGSDQSNIVRLTPACTLDPNWSGIVRGRVNALAIVGTTIYVGGSFTQAGQQGGGLIGRANLASFSITNGVIQTWNPGTDGEVHALKAVSYVSGGSTVTHIVIGGSFTQVAGAPRLRLAAVDTNGAATSFVADADAPVLAIDSDVISSTNPRLWVGGEFTTIGGVSRDRIAQIALTSGTVSTTFNPAANGRVRTVAVTGTSNLTVFVGGDFTQMGGAARNFLGSVSDSGVALPFAPNPDGPVFVVTPDSPSFTSSVFVGGRFTRLSGATRLNAGRVNPTNHALFDWNPGFNGDVRALVVSSFTGRVGVGGDFDAIAAQRRQNLAAINLDTGQLLTLRPNVNDAVRALTIRNDVLYVGGDFTQVDGQARGRLAAFNLNTQALNTWDPSANGAVHSLIWTGDTVFAGGDFTTIGGSGRVRVAGIHATTGAVTSWSPPSVDAVVRTLALQDTNLYVGGSFTSIGGAPALYLARLNSTTGAHDVTWAPAPNGEVRAICVEPGVLYAGGSFSIVGALARLNLVALSTTTGVATLWQPDPNDAVNALSCSSTRIYAGGAFTTVGTGSAQQSRPRLAALLPSATGPTGVYATTFRARNLGVVRSVLQAFDGVLAGASGDPSTEEDEPVARLAFFAENFNGAPGAPLTPSVFTLGTSTTRFRWSPPIRGPRPTGYLLEAGTGPGLTNLSGGFPLTGTQFDFPVPAGTYYVRFRAMNSFGVSAPSDELIFTVTAGINVCSAPPDPPQDFTATVTGSLISLSWAPGSGEATNGFRLEAGGAPGSAEFIVPFGATTFTFEANAPPGVFYARIRSLGQCGTSIASPEAQLVTGGVAAPPSAPRNFTATVNGSTVSFSWSAPSSGTATSYRLDVGSGPGLTNLASLGVSGTTFTVQNVPSGTYYLRLHAIGATGIGPPSDELILVVP